MTSSYFFDSKNNLIFVTGNVKNNGIKIFLVTFPSSSHRIYSHILLKCAQTRAKNFIFVFVPKQYNTLSVKIKIQTTVAIEETSFGKFIIHHECM